ncbi:MAG: aspartate ammonia-lyase, partial [Isosphaeraceae bacterium]
VLGSKCVAGIEADEAACASTIERSLAMCTALAPRIGYDAAAGVAKLAFKTGRNVREVALDLAGKTPEEAQAILGVPFTAASLTAEEVARLLDPFGQTVRGTGVVGG